MYVTIHFGVVPKFMSHTAAVDGHTAVDKTYEFEVSAHLDITPSINQAWAVLASGSWTTWGEADQPEGVRSLHLEVPDMYGGDVTRRLVEQLHSALTRRVDGRLLDVVLITEADNHSVKVGVGHVDPVEGCFLYRVSGAVADFAVSEDLHSV